MSHCCVSGFQWNGKPQGRETKLGNFNAYVAGSDTQKDAAIMIVSDMLGWTLTNTRLLADHFAKEANATVYLPDFFEGEVVPADILDDEKTRDEFLARELKPWLERHSKANRAAPIHDAAKVLKQDLGYKKVGAIGYCWGGWAVFQLAAKGKNMVDCISAAHPSLLTKEEINELAVPVQILAPEHDMSFTPELKEYTNKTIPALGIEYDYQYFPKLMHGFGTRGDPNDETSKKGMERAKNAASAWFGTHLH
ncbi:MAG: hypothetical protein Q9222_002988 [Ikaeria aurantiellina]